MTYRYMTLSDLEASRAPNKVARLDESRQRRDAIRNSDPALFANVSRVLFECDPIGLNFVSNTDEHESEAGTIIPRLQTAKGVDEVEQIVYDELMKWFGPAVVRPTTNVRGCAERLWSLRASLSARAPGID
jgi:hypothetical protein